MIYSRHSNKDIITATTVIILLILSGCTGMQSHSANKPIMELNTDRPGSDISTMSLDKAKPILCHDACKSNSECVAWTYVKPGIINTMAHCRLKSKAPEPKRSSCCISGIK